MTKENIRHLLVLAVSFVLTSLLVILVTSGIDALFHIGAGLPSVSGEQRIGRMLPTEGIESRHVAEGLSRTHFVRH